jgi:hypothetical protein
LYVVQRTVEKKVEEMFKKAAAIKKRDKRMEGRIRHWARNCPSLNEKEAGLGPRHQP